MFNRKLAKAVFITASIPVMTFMLGTGSITAHAEEDIATSTDAVIETAVDENAEVDKNAVVDGNVGNTADTKADEVDAKPANAISPIKESGSDMITTAPAPALSYFDGVDYSAVYDYYYYIEKNPDVKKAFNGNQEKTLQHFIAYGMKEGRRASESFDITSYRNAYRDLRAAFGYDYAKYYIHYMNYGKKEGRISTGVTKLQNAVTKLNGVDYSAVYNYDYYLSKNTDVKKAFNGDEDKTLQHFVKYGMKEKRTSSGSFDVNSYMNAYADLRQAFEGDYASYYMHYVNYGKREGRKTTGVSTRVGSVTKLRGDNTDYSAVFNADFYFNKYSDIKKAFGFNNDFLALHHFVNYGMKEGRQGSKNFDVRSYRYQYRDLRQAFGKDLPKYYKHYIQYGKKEGRKATGITSIVDPITTYRGVDLSSIYDYNYYVSHNPDVVKALGDDDQTVIEHFVKYGLKENRTAKAGADKSTYSRYIALFNERSNITINGRKYHIDANGNITSWFGIDVSHYQGVIDWNAVKADGVDFAILRAGFRGYGSLKLVEDSQLMNNIINANKAGVPIGLYFFTQAINEEEAMEEAEFTVGLIKKYGGKVDLPIFIDSESQKDENGNGTRHNNISAQQRTNVIKAFCERVKQLGYKPGYYGGYYWPFYSEQLTQYPRWFAYYPTDINLNRNILDKHGLPYEIWQYSSSGTIKGINGRVDYNIWYR